MRSSVDEPGCRIAEVVALEVDKPADARPDGVVEESESQLLIYSSDGIVDVECISAEREKEDR